jgi:hypothetical protein
MPTPEQPGLENDESNLSGPPYEALDDEIVNERGYEEPPAGMEELNAEPRTAPSQPVPLVAPIPDAPKLQPMAPLGVPQQPYQNDRHVDALLQNSVPLQGTATPNMADGGSSRPSGDRSYMDAQNAFAPDAKKFGRKAANPEVLDRQTKTGQFSTPKIPTSTSDLAEVGARKLLGNYADTKAGQALSGLVNDAQNVAKLFATGGADVGSWWALTKKYWKPICGVIIIGEAPFLILAIALAASLSHYGDQPAGLAVAANSQFGGKYCANIMQPTLTTTYKGQGVTLTLSSTQSGFSEEDPVIPDGPNAGQVDSTLSGQGIQSGKLSFWNYYVSQHAAGDFPESWLPYYVTSRWPAFSWSWTGHDQAVEAPVPQDAYYELFAGKRIVIYDPATNKAVLGIAMESGNAPYAAAYSKLGTSSSAQESLWDTGSKNGYRATDPVGYKGRSIGGPYPMNPKSGGPSIETSLGITPGTGSDVPVIFGFASTSLQTEAPGTPLTCNVTTTTTTSVTNSSSGTVATVGVQDDSNSGQIQESGTSHFVQNVPGIRQATYTDCNQAAAAMVILHYKPGATGITTTDGKGNLVNKQGGCLSSVSGALQTQLSGATDASGAITFKQIASKSDITVQMIEQSIDAGDPVIVNAAGVYSSGNHFVVIVGYDNSTFYINDPFPWGIQGEDTSTGTVHIYTNESHNSPHTQIGQEQLINGLTTENTSGYVAVMRSR